MKISYLGGSCFCINHEKTNILIDPIRGGKADICVVTHENEAISAQEVEAKKVLDWPGEYEVSEIMIEAFDFFRSPKDSDVNLGSTLIFAFDFNNGERVCHLGAVGCKLTPEMVEKLGDISILMIPIGGENTVGPKKAKEIISSIEPNFVIPMSYGDNLPSFLKEVGAEEVEEKEFIDTKKIKYTSEKTEILVLKENI